MLRKDLFYYQKAGRIAAEVRNEARSFIKEGTPLIEICERIEKKIRKKGGIPAFPCNICINEVAAHYSSPPNDTKIVPKSSLIKIDLGVHIGGYIADTATTISFNLEYNDMINAVNTALNQAIKSIRPGINNNEVGKIIEKTIERSGFKPVWNLSGHQMSKYILHTGKSIPNVSKFILKKETIREGDIYAVEPFLTLPSGSGKVRNIDEAYIYRFQRERSINNPNAKRLLKRIKQNFKTLPFSERWLQNFSIKDTNSALEELLLKKCLVAYPVLIEEKGKVVAQAEHTIVVTKEGCLITTL